MTRHGRTQGCAIPDRVNRREREGFAREGVTEIAERGVVKGRGHPRARGRAQLSGRSSKRSARETRKKARRKRVGSVFDSRYSPMRRAPTTDDLYYLWLVTEKEERERERERERETQRGERHGMRSSVGTVMWWLISSDEYSLA